MLKLDTNGKFKYPSKTSNPILLVTALLPLLFGQNNSVFQKSVGFWFILYTYLSENAVFCTVYSIQHAHKI